MNESPLVSFQKKHKIEFTISDSEFKRFGKKKKEIIYLDKNDQPAPQNIINDMLRFTRKQPKGTIDVWWLFDDGGIVNNLCYLFSWENL